MSRGIYAMAALVVVAGAIAAAPSFANEDGGQGRQLVGTVSGESRAQFSITLQDEDGAPVTSLRPGNYRLTVHDLSARHNFHVIGDDLDETVTTVPFIGTTSVKLHLTHGTYTFQCDPHAAIGMKLDADVGGVGQTD
jgi:hypothetical protein